MQPRLGLRRGPGVSITRQACPSSGWFLAQARVHAFQPECPLLFGEDPIGKRTLRSWRLRSSIPFQPWRRPWISQTLDFIGLCPGRIRVRDVWVSRLSSRFARRRRKLQQLPLLARWEPLRRLVKASRNIEFDYLCHYILRNACFTHRNKARCMPKRYLEVSNYLRR